MFCVERAMHCGWLSSTSVDLHYNRLNIVAFLQECEILFDGNCYLWISCSSKSLHYSIRGLLIGKVIVGGKRTHFQNSPQTIVLFCPFTWRDVTLVISTTVIKSYRYMTNKSPLRMLLNGFALFENNSCCTHTFIT